MRSAPLANRWTKRRSTPPAAPRRAMSAAGIDVGNNGEQMREAFFLYVRHRMSGFGGGWTRRPFADVARYPGFQAWGDAIASGRPTVSNRDGVPEAVGDVRYLDPALVQ